MGGHYVPAITHAVWKDGSINVKGMGIGNGLTHPAEQYQWYPEMAFDGGKTKGGSLEKGVITNPFAQGIMKAALGPCTKAIESCDAGSTAACATAFLICNYGETIPYQVTGMNVYDMRAKCTHPPLCYDFSAPAAFLNDEDVQSSLGVSKSWQSCNMLVNTYFRADFMRSYMDQIPEVLEAGLKVMVYAGDVDYICNWLGNKAWVTDKLAWSGQEGFQSAEDKTWTVGGKAAGRWRKYKNLEFIQVYQAGHMVPMDQPEAALAMINSLLNQGNVTLSSSPVVVDEVVQDGETKVTTDDGSSQVYI